ncbi:MAG: CTP-dependent riboflavin kinase [Desulfobacterales bacterium]
METHLEIMGKVISGAGEGAYFTQIDWVQQQCHQKLGFKPSPGTLNVEVASDDLPKIVTLDPKKGVALISPDSKFCNAVAFPVMLEEVKAAIIRPEEKVRIHAANVIEIIAPLNIKTFLNVNDGDEIKFVLAGE